MTDSLLLTVLITPLEAAINVLLRTDPHALAELNRCAGGRLLAIKCTSFPSWQMGLLITPQRLLLRSTGFSTETSAQKNSSHNDVPDACIAGSHSALSGLLLGKDPAQALHHPELTIQGDVHLIQALHKTLRQLDLDWEDVLAPWLRPVFGEVPTHLAAQGLHRSTETLQQGLSSFNRNLADYLQEESGLLPTRTEVNAFADRLDTLRLRLDRLNARTEHLRQLVTN